MHQHPGHVIALAALASALSLGTVIPLDAQRTPPASKGRADAFSRVRCDGDVVRALVGGRMPDERVAVLEAAHADIRLKDVGGSDVDDDLFLGGWEICGKEYEVLVRRNRVEDVLELPAHSRRRPAFLGSCAKRDERLEHVLAVLDNPAPRAEGQPRYAVDDTTSLAAIAAWRIDTRTRRLQSLSTDGLRCPRGGIFTRDGGT